MDTTSTVAIIIPAGGAIFDDSTASKSLYSPAVVTLPKPGVTGSLGDNADIVIDTE